MSYLSTTENVGFNGIPQNISDASCATQYKMAVDGVSGSCGDVNMFVHDSSGDEQYITHLNDNFFHTKFKIDPNELYTFHDSDVIAGEITVSHTEEHLNFSESSGLKNKYMESPTNEIDLIDSLANGEIKEEKVELVTNGHYPPVIKNSLVKNNKELTLPASSSNVKPLNTKIIKVRNNSQTKESVQSKSGKEIQRLSIQSDIQIQSPKVLNSDALQSLYNSSIDSVNNGVSTALTPKTSASETFLDVFKREQGLVVNATVIKTEPTAPPPPPGKPTPVPKKTPSASKPSQAKARKGRGPAVHEALQRISAQKRAIAVANQKWHAPGQELFTCGPLDNKTSVPFSQLESSSSDDDNMPGFETGCGPVCLEELSADSRGARLALRRAALRRQVTYADTALRLATDFRKPLALATIINKQLCKKKSTCKLPPQLVNYLLSSRGMSSLLTSLERRRLRESGWSGGDSLSIDGATTVCSEDRCTNEPLPCARYCLTHITQAADQRLYAACAAVFAGGSRCMQPLLPLHDQTPLCTEHAWKRDNYDKLSKDPRPKKPAAPRKRVWAPAARPPAARPPPARPPPARPPPARPPRRPKRRRRAAPLKPHPHHSLSEINVCSNSSAYDSSEDTAIGTLSETEYMVPANNSHELEVEVGHAPPDDILDPSVLSQIPDEAFTEFFNQAEGSGPFAESSELAAALEAVLEERVLDERALNSIADSIVFTQDQVHEVKVECPEEPDSSHPNEPS